MTGRKFQRREEKDSSPPMKVKVIKFEWASFRAKEGTICASEYYTITAYFQPYSTIEFCLYQCLQEKQSRHSTTRAFHIVGALVGQMFNVHQLSSLGFVKTRFLGQTLGRIFSS